MTKPRGRKPKTEGATMITLRVTHAQHQSIVAAARGRLNQSINSFCLQSIRLAVISVGGKFDELEDVADETQKEPTMPVQQTTGGEDASGGTARAAADGGGGKNVATEVQSEASGTNA